MSAEGGRDMPLDERLIREWIALLSDRPIPYLVMWAIPADEMHLVDDDMRECSRCDNRTSIVAAATSIREDGVVAIAEFALCGPHAAEQVLRGLDPGAMTSTDGTGFEVAQ